MSELFYNTAVARYAEIMLKGLGVAILTHISSLVCRECGKPTLADAVETAGKLEIFAFALPLIYEIIKTSAALLEL